MPLSDDDDDEVSETDCETEFIPFRFDADDIEDKLD